MLLAWLIVFLGVAGFIFSKLKATESRGAVAASPNAPPPWFVWNYVIPACNWLSKTVPNATAPPHFRLLDLTTQFVTSRCIQVLAKWGVADIIGDGTITLDQLAKKIGAREDGVDRIMRHVINVGVFTEEGFSGSKVYKNNAFSSPLRGDSPVSVRALVRHMGTDIYPGFVEMEYAAKKSASGAEGSAFKKVFGMEIWDFFDVNTDLRANFAEAMTTVDSFSIEPLVQDYPWSKFNRVIDVGGSLGSVPAALLQNYSNLQGVIFDLPGVVAQAEKTWKNSETRKGLMNRMQFKSGSFFDANSIPAADSDKDCYIVRNIFHDWSTPKTKQILTRIREACGDVKASLVIIELLPREPADSDPFVSFMNLNMMNTVDGMERSVNQHWKPLFDEVGFKIQETVETRSKFRILRATPA